MFPFSHILAGYTVILFLTELNLLEITTLSLVLTAFLSILPDIDILWKKNIGDHHKTLSHAPLFWLLVSAIIFTVNQELSILLFSLTYFHLITDYITGRTVGIAFLYPFDVSEYSLFELDSSTRNLKPLKPEKKVLFEHLSYYIENRKLLIFELLVNIAGLYSLYVLV